MKKITITDATLRECARRGDIALSFKEKIEIAKLLDKLNIDVIEAAPVTDEKIDTLVLRTISPLLKNSILSCPAGCTVEEADRAMKSISGTAKPRLLVSLPVSAVQMEYFYHKKPAQMLELIASLTAHCSSICSDVEFSAVDATRADKAYLFEAIKAAIVNGAKTVTLCDTAGAFLPDEFASLISEIREAIPEARDITLSAECSDALDMANACVFSCIEAGATQIKTCIGSKELPNLEHVMKALQVKGHTLDVSYGVNAMAINHSANQILSMTSESGKGSFSSGSSRFAAENNVLLDDTADITKVSKAIVSLGYELTEDDTAKVFEAFKSFSGKKQVGSKELDAIIATVAHQVPPTYRLENYVINSGNHISSTANIELEKGSRSLKAVGMGDGPIDAAFRTVEQIIGHHYELDDFQIQSVTEGREAMGEALVKLRSNGKLYSGKGLSTDIIGASITAYINALNKIVYEEGNA
ncbi:MAG: hypothetical protein IJD78_08970 [Clostridia bacterium]|nr:hypothetical protein [Clostridia bacterium]